MKYALIFIAFFLASCSSSHRAPTLASTKATAVPPHKVLGKAQAKDCQSYVMFYFTDPVDFKKMRHKVLEQAAGMGGDAVVDFSIRGTSSTLIYPFYIGSCYEASGTVVKFGGTSAWDAPPELEKQETKSVWD